MHNPNKKQAKQVRRGLNNYKKRQAKQQNCNQIRRVVTAERHTKETIITCLIVVKQTTSNQPQCAFALFLSAISGFGKKFTSFF